MSPRLAFALDAAYQAGRLTLRYFQTDTQVDLKSDETPVTDADRGAEALIRSLIEKKYPGDTVLGEEQGLSGASDDRWVIDPIDGTKSFISGVPLYGTLLSYEQAGEPVIGICYFPALDEMIYAAKGEGAFWNGRQAKVSGRSDLAKSRIVCGSIVSLDKRDSLTALLALAKLSIATRTWGDAYGHALVATGRVDLMIDPVVNRWDISAMSLIVREAGGRFTDFQGGEALVNEAISSNGLVHAAALEAFRV
jgi:histidinol-phosphatase